MQTRDASSEMLIKGPVLMLTVSRWAEVLTHAYNVVLHSAILG
jgi:hypothetical protein